jgi:hypothetical protein
VQYGGRAFDQDAQLAIKGDVVRALIELVTNADDAYDGGTGEVVVVVERSDIASFPVRVAVHDQARGLTADGLIECFTVLGAEKSGFAEGKAVRGLLGRGAKDVASLGRVTFEAIRDDAYSSLTLTSEGAWTLNAANEPPPEGCRSRLRIPADHNGLVATVDVASKFKVPTSAALQRDVGNHAQLRDLCRRRLVRLVDERTSTGTTLTLAPEEERGEVISDQSLTLDGYGDAVIRIRRLPTLRTGSVSPTSEHGILVCGRNATYENTSFKLDARPEFGWIAGRVICEQIEDLILAYDHDASSSQNPERLVSRDRDGLAKNHPFTRELHRAVNIAVLPMLDALREQEQVDRREGDKLAKAFKAARLALSQEVSTLLREIDEEVPDGGLPVAPESKELELVPPKVVLQPGESKTLSVRAAEGPEPTLTARVQSARPHDVLAVDDGQSFEFTAHPRLAALASTLRVTAGQRVGTASVVISDGVNVARADIEVMELEPAEAAVPEDLMFEKRTYGVAPGRARRLRLLAPSDLDGAEVALRYRESEVEGPSTVHLRPSPDGRMVMAEVRVVAGSTEGRALIDASVDDRYFSSCELNIKQSEARGGLDFNIEVRDQDHSTRRAVALASLNRIDVTVYGRHPTIRTFLGRYSVEEEKFEHEDTPAARAVLAEAIGLELANHVVELETIRRATREWDAARVFARQRDVSLRLVKILQRVLDEGA